MAISWKGDATISFAATDITPAMPTHAAGDMLLAIFAGKPFDAGVSVSGWTSLGSGASGSTAAGVDVGSMKVQVWYKIAASSSETAPTMTEGSPVFNTAGGCVVAWQKGASETWDTPVIVFGGDEDLDKDLSATMASNPGFTAADGVQIAIGVGSDASTPLTAGPGITATGATFGTVTKDRDLETTGGGDMGMVTAHCLVSSGTSSAAAVVTGTGTSDPGSPRWEVGVVRLRVTANVNADGEVAWAEFEVPNARARAEIAWSEFEVPNARARADIAWAEFEVPNARARAEIAWSEFEVPSAAPDPANAEVSWAEFEVPTAQARAEVAWAEFEVPDLVLASARADVSWAEFEVSTAQARADVSWAEFEVPTARARADIAWVEFALPDSPARADLAWAEFQVNDPGVGGAYSNSAPWIGAPGQADVPELNRTDTNESNYDARLAIREQWYLDHPGAK